MILPIIQLPNANLRQKSASISDKEISDPTTQKFIDDLIETMYKKDGIGLAAIQVDKPWQIFVVATADGPIVFINPQITKKSWRKEIDEEGCLSIPNIFGKVKRHKKITITALDRQGKTFTKSPSGLFARVIQHENDHLNGILFIDKSLKITKGGEILAKLKK